MWNLFNWWKFFHFQNSRKFSTNFFLSMFLLLLHNEGVEVRNEWMVWKGKDNPTFFLVSLLKRDFAFIPSFLVLANLNFPRKNNFPPTHKTAKHARIVDFHSPSLFFAVDFFHLGKWILNKKIFCCFLILFLLVDAQKF